MRPGRSARNIVLAAAAVAVLLPGVPCPAGEYHQAVRAQKSLVSHYTFDDAAPRDTVARHHGKIVGGPVTYGPGPKGLGKAIVMRDGKAVVEFGHVKAFSFADGSGTVEVLMRNSGRNVGGTNYIFAQRKGWAPNSMRYGFCFPGLKSINIVSRGARPNFMQGPVVIEPGKWYHLAVVYAKGRAAAAYVNGQSLRLGGGAPLEDGASGQTFHLGGCNAVPDWETWAGSFDELAIYADALPAAVIAKHAGLAGCVAPIRTAAAPRPKPRPAPSRPAGSRQTLRKAIVDMTATFGARYPRGKEFLARLDKLPTDDRGAFEKLQREAFVANPLLSERPLLFVTRHRYRSHYHAIDMLFHTGEGNWDRKCAHDAMFSPGGAMKTIDLKTGKVTTLIETATGVVRDPDVHWDGKRIVLAMRRRRDEDYHIYEMNIDGSGLRQLTSLRGVADFDPVYLPDETIVFASTRDPKYNMCSRDHASNLYRMNSDGSNIYRITRNTLFDNHPEIMPDGRILYARWEYVDRNFGDAHSIWVVNPDGTNQAIY